VNLAQIRSAVPDLVYKQSKKKQKATDSANNRTLYSLRACGEKYKKEQKRVARSVEVKTLLKSSFLPNVTV